MGLSDAIARSAARHAHALVVEVPGWWRTRAAVERAVLARGWQLAFSPADADVLVVCGEPGPRLGEAVGLVWDQMPGPRVRVDVREYDDVDGRLDEAYAGHISMWNDGPAAVAVSSYINGWDETNLTDEQLAQIEEDWIAQKPIGLSTCPTLVGGRIGTSGWSLVGSRFGHTRDLVLSFDLVLPSGQVIQVGDGGGRKTSKSSSGFQLKHLFMGHQGTLGVATRATLKLFPKPEAEFSPFYAFSDFDSAYRTLQALAHAGVATFAGAVLFDEQKVSYLRRDDEAYIPQPGDVRSLVCAVAYGNVVGAMVLLQQAGAETVGFVTDPLDTYPVPE